MFGGGAADALGEIKDTRAIKPLINAFKEGDVMDFQYGISEALVKIGKPAVEPLITALKDSDVNVRKNAVSALGNIKDARAVKPLINALRDSTWAVRTNAGWALSEMGKPAVEPLVTALKNKDVEVVARVYWFFIKRGEPGSEPVLIEALIKFGYSGMALDFRNCGNSKLEKAADKWAERHGIKVKGESLSGEEPRWGKTQ